MFVIYLLALSVITLAPTPITRTRRSYEESVNLVPVVRSAKIFAATLKPGKEHLTIHHLRNILGNIALFLPLGIFLPFLSDRLRSFRVVLFMAAALSVSIEAAQLISRVFGNFRSVDIDDVLLNTLGALTGRLLATIWKSKF